MLAGNGGTQTENRQAQDYCQRQLHFGCPVSVVDKRKKHNLGIQIVVQSSAVEEPFVFTVRQGRIGR